MVVVDPAPVSSPGRVLLVEPELATAEIFVQHLQRAGFCVGLSSGARGALEDVSRLRPDLVVLDAFAPDGGGRELFTALHAAAGVPLVLLSRAADEEERTRYLEMGADDFVPRPVAPTELVARVRSVLRRVQAPPRRTGGVLEAGSVRVDEVERVAYVRGRPVVLTALELRLLSFFLNHPHEALTREQLLEAVWGYTISGGATVTVHVRRLREKIEPSPAQPRLIRTVWGVGYRFEPQA